MAINQINRAEFDRLYKEKYTLACRLLDCEAFKSWHTPTKSEWSEALNAIKKMLKQYEWPLHEVRQDGDDASSKHMINTSLMLNSVHNLLNAFNPYSGASVPSPGQWGDIMRVADETAEHRVSVDEAAKL